MRFHGKLYDFMRYRYGIDDLYRFLLCLYIFFAIIHLFVASVILTVIELLLFIIIFYRVFSKNISKRRRENEIYIGLMKRVLKPFYGLLRDYRDKKVYVYRRCHYCKKILRLPLPDKRGIKYITCPKCKKRIKTFIVRRQKVEVIFEKGRTKR